VNDILRHCRTSQKSESKKTSNHRTPLMGCRFFRSREKFPLFMGC
jgi:hypothetical protein